MQWIAHLEDEDWRVVFIPISIRYGTNRPDVFYQALASCLASILDEGLPIAPGDPATFYKEKVVEYLELFDWSQRQVLIVIDGLDEVSGWQVVDSSALPPQPPPGVRIVASARQVAGDRGTADWLRRLGWVPPRGAAVDMEVPPLSEGGIQSVLDNAGLSTVGSAEGVDTARELLKLTDGGEPLLVELYTNDLRTGTSVRALASREPGFAAYFRDWFEDQEKSWRASGIDVDSNQLNALLAVLSCALGPLDLPVLERVAQGVLPQQQLLLTPRSLEPIRRFVIGDGREQGYVFAHPKLGEFVRDEWLGGTQFVARAQDAFIQWGRGLVQELDRGSLAAAKAPEYALLYHVQHLESAQPGVPTLHYRELLGKGWQLAWREHPDGLHGFARDAEIVWSRMQVAFEDPALLREPQTGLGGLIRCALCLSSVRSFGIAVPPHFMAELVRQGLVGLGQAVALCRSKDEDERARSLVALTPVVEAEGFGQLVAEVRGLTEWRLKADTLAELAQQAPVNLMESLWLEAGAVIVQEAPAVVQDDGNSRSQAIEDIVDSLLGFARELPEAARRSWGDTARKIARDCEDATTRVSVLGKIAAELDAPHELPLELAPQAPESVDPSRERIPPEPARERIRAVLDDWDRHSTLAELVPLLTEEVLDELVELLCSAEHRRVISLSEELGVIAPYLAPDSLGKAARLLLAADEPWGYFVSRALEALLPHAAQHRALLMEVLDSALKAVQPWQLDDIIKLFGPHLHPEDDGWYPIIRAVEAGADTYDHTEAVRELGSRLKGAPLEVLGQVVLALTERTSELCALAPHLSADALRRAVVACGDNLVELDCLLPHLPAGDRSSIVAEKYRLGIRIGDDLPFFAALSGCAAVLPDSESPRAVGLALEAARSARSPFERCAAMISGQRLPHLAPPDRDALRIDTEASFDAIDDELRPTLLIARALAEHDESAARAWVTQGVEGIRSMGPERLWLVAPYLLMCSLTTDEELDEVIGWYQEAVSSDIEPDSVGLVAMAAFTLQASAALLPPRHQSAATTVVRQAAVVLQQNPDPEQALVDPGVLDPEPWIAADIEALFDRRQLIRAPPMRASLLSGHLLSYLAGERLLVGARELLQATLAMTRASMLASSLMGLGVSVQGLDVLGRGAAHVRQSAKWLERLPAEPWISRLGGPHTPFEVFEALRDVREWWP